MDAEKQRQLKETLDRCHEWPCCYTFKFIVPKDSLDELLGRLEGLNPTTRESSGGKYVSVTAEPTLETVEEALEIYGRVDGVPGLMCM